MIPPPGDVFAQIRTICDPLRAGMRFRAVPAAQMWVADGKVNRLGPLLPAGSESESAYQCRVADAGHPRFALRIIEPWALSPEWWSWTRDSLRPIWRHRGQPVVPVETELIYSHGLTPPARQAEDQATWTWLLAGDTEPALATGEACQGEPGDPMHLRGAPTAVWLRVLVGTDSRRVVAAAAEAVAADLAAGTGGTPTPYTPWRDFGDEIPELRTVSDRVSEIVGRPDHERRLMAQWLRRSSACGLEPVPPPRPPLTGIPTDQRLTRRTDVLHAQVGSELLCAANGHLFSIAEPSLAGLMARINATTTPFTIGDLTDTWPERVVRAAVTRLHQMRAVEVVA